MHSSTLPYPGNPNWGIRAFEGSYDRPRRVEVVNRTGLFTGLWFKLFHAQAFETLTVPADTLAQSCRRECALYLEEATVEGVMAQFTAQIGHRKRIRKTEWTDFCYAIKVQEVPEVIGEAYFFTVTGDNAYGLSNSPVFTLTQPIDPGATYLQGASWVESVNVLPDYQKRGIGTTLYRAAESIFQLPIIPASPLSDAGKALHRKLGKIL